MSRKKRRVPQKLLGGVLAVLLLWVMGGGLPPQAAQKEAPVSVKGGAVFEVPTRLGAAGLFSDPGQFIASYRQTLEDDVVEPHRALVALGDSWLAYPDPHALGRSPQPVLSNLLYWLGVMGSGDRQLYPAGAVFESFYRQRGGVYSRHPLVIFDSATHGETVANVASGTATNGPAQPVNLLLNTQRLLTALDQVHTEAGMRAAPPVYLLLSGGGNDLLDPSVLAAMFQNRPCQAAHWHACFSVPVANQALNRVMGAYEAILTQARTVAPNVTVLAHTYDFIVPTASRPNSWLGPVLTQLGLTRQADQFDMAYYMLGKFRARLMALSERHPNLQVVDTQGTLVPGGVLTPYTPKRDDEPPSAVRHTAAMDTYIQQVQACATQTTEGQRDAGGVPPGASRGAACVWRDEIHPNQVGFMKLAAKIYDRLVSLESAYLQRTAAR